MWAKFLVLVCLFHAVHSEWISVGSGCVGARSNKYKEITYTGSNFFMGAVKLVHTSGFVGCHGAARSNWGCSKTGAGAGATFLNMVVTDAYNQVIFPSRRLEIKAKYKSFYHLPGFTSSSPELVLSDFGNPTYLKYGDKLRVWYGEDLYDHTEGDNHGNTCMDVYVYKLAI